MAVARPDRSWHSWFTHAEPLAGASRELLSIQYLRAFAAMAVLTYHAVDRVGLHFGPGAAGVDVFFVVSGFIMWVISGNASNTAGNFLARRAARIVPLYWLVTMAVVSTAFLVPASFPNLRPTFSHIIQSLLFHPYRDPDGLIVPLIVPGWTLNYEVFFYLIFAGCLLFSARRRLFILAGTFGLLAIIGLLFRPSDPALATYTDPMLIEFLGGAWLGRIWAEGFRLRPGASIGAISLGLAGFALVAVSGMDVDRLRLLLWGIPAWLIVAGAVSLEPLRDWLVVKFLGDASYSIYLVHGLALGLVGRLLGAIHLDTATFIVLEFGAGIVAGSVCYLIVERPLLLLFHPARRKPLEHLPSVLEQGAVSDADGMSVPSAS